MMNKILILLITTICLSGCDLYDFDKSPKDNPTNGQGTVGDAKDLALVSGANQVGLVNTALGSAYEVRVLDSKSRPIAGETITFSVLDQNSIEILTQTVTTDNSGIASLSITPTVFGQLSVKIEPVNTSNTVSPLVVPVKVIGPPDSISIVSGNNQSISAGSALGVIKFQVKDANGELVPNGSATVDGNAVSANASGEVSFTLATPNTLTGSYTFNGALANGATVVATYSVVPSTPASLTVVSGNNQTLTAGDDLSDMVVEVKDGYGNLVPNAEVDFSGSSVTSNASGLATFNGGTKTTAGSYSYTASLGSLSQTFSYSVAPGPLASLVVDSGNNQVLPRSVNSNDLKVKGYDSYSNPKSGNTITWTDGTWSSTSNLTSGSASIVYPTPLLVGNKTITASSGLISVSFSLTVNNYAPLTAVISTTDDLTYSVISSRTVTYAEFTNLGPVAVNNASVPTDHLGYTKSGSGTAVTDESATAYTDLNTSLVNVSSPTDILSVISTATFPAGVTANSCTLVNQVVDSLTCKVNDTMTFTRDQILGGDFKIKVQSNNKGGPEDYLVSNTLPTSKKIVLKQFFFNTNEYVIVAGGDSTTKKLYLRGPYGNPTEMDYDQETFTTLASNITIPTSNASPMTLFNGRFVFVGTNPSDSNNTRFLSYDPSNDIFSEITRINAGSEIPGRIIPWNGALILSNSTTPRRSQVVDSDFAVKWDASSVSLSIYTPATVLGGVEYGYIWITGGGVFKKTGASTLAKVWNIGPTTGSVDATTNNGFVLDASGSLYRFNATQWRKIDTGATDSISMGSKLLVRTKDSAGKNKIFVWNDADSSYKKLRDFNAGDDDFGATDRPLLGVYNGNALICAKVGLNNTIFLYNGSTLKQLAVVSSCDSRQTNGVVVDNAFWFGVKGSLYKVCDTSSGCVE